MRKAEELIGRKVRLIENERMTDTPFTVIAVKGSDTYSAIHYYSKKQ